MLAEPRRKQKISIDPQNVQWRSGDTIGKKLLSRMGWTDGKGIGRNEQGTAENIKLRPNYTNAGFGADLKTQKQDQWISCHDDFASLLKELNEGKGDSIAENELEKEVVSIQSVSKSSKKRIHYKFTRGKDLSLASDQDKKAIFGNVRSKLTENQRIDFEEPTKVTVKYEQFTKNNMSATDYYAEKLKKWGRVFNKELGLATNEETVKRMREIAFEDKEFIQNERTKGMKVQEEDTVEVEDYSIVKEKKKKKLREPQQESLSTDKKKHKLKEEGKEEIQKVKKKRAL